MVLKRFLLLRHVMKMKKRAPHAQCWTKPVVTVGRDGLEVDLIPKNHRNSIWINLLGGRMPCMKTLHTQGFWHSLMSDLLTPFLPLVSDIQWQFKSRTPIPLTRFITPAAQTSSTGSSAPDTGEDHIIFFRSFLLFLHYSYFYSLPFQSSRMLRFLVLYLWPIKVWRGACHESARRNVRPGVDSSADASVNSIYLIHHQSKQLNLFPLNVAYSHLAWRHLCAAIEVQKSKNRKWLHDCMCHLWK